MLTAADKGDVRAAQAAIVAGAAAADATRAAQAQTRQQQQASRDAERQQRQADTAARRQQADDRRAAADARRAAADARRARADRRAAARRESAQLGLRTRHKALLVYKRRRHAALAGAQHDRLPRSGWRILSTAALDADSQRMTATTQFGPLRWWHVGWPQPTRRARRGAGLDPARATLACRSGARAWSQARSRARRWPLRWRAWPMRWNCRPASIRRRSPTRRRVYDDPHVRAQPGAGARRASVEPLFWPDGQGDTHGYFRGGAALRLPSLGWAWDADQVAALEQQLVAADKAAQQAAGIAFKSQDAPEPTVYTRPRRRAGIIPGQPLRGAQGGGPTTAARGARRDEGACDGWRRSGH